jgi:hypothetical protein
MERGYWNSPQRKTSKNAGFLSTGYALGYSQGQKTASKAVLSHNEAMLANYRRQKAKI